MGYSINKVFLVGNITNDLELKKTNSGTSVINFGLATNKSVKRSDGTYEDIPTFHNINAWSHTAEYIAKYMSKGDRVTVFGHLEYDQWEKEGVKQQKAKVVISEIVPMYKKNDGNGVTEGQAREALVANNNDFDPQEDISDDVPF